MKQVIFNVAIAAIAFASVIAESDSEVQARRTALDLAGAFTNDGFKIRDGYWSGTIKPNEHALIAVNLYVGNQYWFAAGSGQSGKKLAVEIFDEMGHQIAAENYAEDEKAAAGFLPANSGQYFISVSLLEGTPSSVCLLCSYK